MLQPDDSVARPLIFDPRSEADRAALEALLARDKVRVRRDTLDSQLDEWIDVLHPRETRDAALPRPKVDDAYRQRCDRWVYFPWRHALVRLLEPQAFEAVRLSRNRQKITAREQDLLRSKRIGVVGLSVGRSAAKTLAMEGIGGELRLADLDTLGLSNLNRLQGSVADLGISKVVLAARDIFEQDPYARLVLFSEGLADQNLDRFLLEGGKLDLVIEECDDLFLKIRLRERARELGIPVLMETSDRGLLDVERFDLEPSRPLLHGLLGEVSAESLRGLSTAEKVPYVLRVLDERQLSPTAAASLIEINETIKSWPQLGSAVQLGAGVVADTARRVLLGQLEVSGRFYVDLGSLVSDGAPAVTPPVELGVRPLEVAKTAPAPLPLPTPGKGEITAEELRFIVAHAHMAPSGGNTQPWRFELRDGVLSVDVETARLSPSDVGYAGTHVAIGAAVENLCWAARAIGLEPRIEPFPDGDPTHVCSIRFDRVPADDSIRLELVRHRVTNRRHANGTPLRREDADALTQTAAKSGGVLRWFGSPEEKRGFASILGAVDHLRFTEASLHRDLVTEVRWTHEEVLGTRTGLDLATLEVAPQDAAVLSVLRLPSTAAELRRIRGGRGIERLAEKSVERCGGIAVLAVDTAPPATYFYGGRILEQVWLEATARGLAVYPNSAFLYLLKRMEDVGDLDGGTRDVLTSVRRQFQSLVPLPPGQTPFFVFLAGYADAPSARSLRLPLERVLRT